MTDGELNEAQWHFLFEKVLFLVWILPGPNFERILNKKYWNFIGSQQYSTRRIESLPTCIVSYSG